MKIVKLQSQLISEIKNATEILNEVLGVSFTMPIWVENSLNEIVAQYSNKEMNENIFDEMRAELATLGLEELMPLAIKNVLRN